MAQLFLETAWLIPCYPLIGSILAVPWSPGIIRRTGPRPAGYINVLMTLVAFLHGLIALSATWNQPAQEVTIPWLQVVNLDLNIPLEFSAITIGATLVITGINLLAQIYAIGYIETDWGWARLYSLLAFFEAGMCALVLCNSLFFGYIILEILTLGTYLLVGFWFNQSLVVTGARDAFLTKRVGDLFLLMGVIAIYPLSGTWNFTELATWASTAHIDPTVATLLGLALIAGPMGKCAQFPLHLWLDLAMEGPVPSTILRNSVVVCTGAWVLIKLQPVIQLSPLATSFTLFIGAVTALGGTMVAIAQIDAKRTLSFLVSAYMGLVFIAVGTGQTQAALTLMLTYAVSMALLVMSLGTIIWNSITQDVTQLGGLWGKRPASGISYLVGAAGLVAIPPLGGFWPLLQLGDYLSNTRPWLFAVLLVVNALASLSLTRVFGLIFGGKPKQMSERSPEVHWPMVFPMLLLMGFVLHVPLILLQWQIIPELSAINTTVAGLLLLSSAVGCGIGSFLYLNNSYAKPVHFGPQSLQNLFTYDFYTQKVYRVTVVFFVDLVSKVISWSDRYIVDGLVNLVGIVTVFGGQSLKYNASGQTQFYVLTILLGIALFGLIVSLPLLSTLSLIMGG
ncbi:NAD(P)H-quinone oxidoreductase subunit F [Lyngbya aestuarii]|uniref:NAD(P)H-quinone oxidoreductase subunit F n=1 Tax=Lyngbya aestuarii TaxID=118322 RepID=UPI00403DB6C3